MVETIEEGGEGGLRGMFARKGRGQALTLP